MIQVTNMNDRHYKHALKGHLGYIGRRRITNLLSCTLEAYLLTYKIKQPSTTLQMIQKNPDS